jgi:hypothetical protein
MNVTPIFGISVLCSFIAWGLVAGLYVWPRLAAAPAKTALMALIAPHLFRFVGLSFLVPGVVSAALSQATFAREAALGDLAAAFLAIVATVALAADLPWAAVVVWVFNLWGTADLLNAIIQGPAQLIRAGLSPGLMGAAFFIPTLLVPGLLVSHVLIFRLLTKRASIENAVTT